MTQFLAAFVIFCLAMFAMAIGVIIGRRRIKGSCGGLANLRDEHGRITCDACAHPSEECTGEPAPSHAATNAQRDREHPPSKTARPRKSPAR